MNARRSIIVFANQVICVIIGIVITKITLTIFKPADFGIMAYALSLSGLFLTFTDLQMSLIFCKRIAEGEDIERHYSTYTSLKFILTLISFICFVFYITLIYFLHSVSGKIIYILFLVFISYFTDLYLNGLISLYNTKRDVKITQLVTIFITIFHLGYILGIVYPSRNLYLYALSMLAKSIVGLVAFGYLLRNKMRIVKFGLDRAIIKDYVKFMVPLLPVSILGFVYDKIDATMIAFFLSFSEAGYFAAAQRINSVLLLASGSVGMILYSLFSEVGKLKDYSKMQAISNKATRYSSIFINLISIFLFFNTRKVVLLLMSYEYLPAIPIIQIFLLQAILMTVSRTFDTIIVVTEHLKFLSIASLIQYAVGICLNFILIPNKLLGFDVIGMGSRGPAVKYLILYIANILICSTFLYVRLGIKIYWRFVLHIAVAMLAGFAVNIMLEKEIMNIMVYLTIYFSIFCSLYFIALFAIKEMGKDDVRYFMDILGVQLSKGRS